MFTRGRNKKRNENRCSKYRRRISIPWFTSKQITTRILENLGSSKTRTKEQEIKGRDLILQKITETTENTAIAFTDGSCLNNPGPCGAGAIVFVEEETTELKQPVCKRG